jgi:hypothetical protein
VHYTAKLDESMPMDQSTSQTCPICGTALEDARCPNCDSDSVLSARGVPKALTLHFLFTGAGLVALAYVIDDVYKLLDAPIFFLIGLALFCVPFFFHWRYGSRNPPRPADLSVARKVQVCAGIIIWSFVVLVDCNGALDRSVMPMQTNIVTSQVGHRRSGESYSLIVKSWRPGIATETLSVDYQTYEAALAAQTVTVDVHQGFFGWPWYSNVQADSYR